MALVPGVYHNKAMGLSSPQIGYHKRFILLNMLENGLATNHIEICLNPAIIEADGPTCVLQEGCLSSPQ